MGNFYDKIVSYIDDIFHGCSLIPRVAKHLDKDFETNPDASYHYLQAIQNHPELKQMRSALMNRVQDAMDKANRYKDKHMDYSYIWTDSRKEYMHYFLTYSRYIPNKSSRRLFLFFRFFLFFFFFFRSTEISIFFF